MKKGKCVFKTIMHKRIKFFLPPQICLDFNILSVKYLVSLSDLSKIVIFVFCAVMPMLVLA